MKREKIEKGILLMDRSQRTVKYIQDLVFLCLGINSMHLESNHRITDLDLEGTHQNHLLQLLAPHITIQNSNPTSESVVQTLPEIPLSWGASYHAGPP